MFRIFLCFSIFLINGIEKLRKRLKVNALAEYGRKFLKSNFGHKRQVLFAERLDMKSFCS